MDGSGGEVCCRDGGQVMMSMNLLTRIVALGGEEIAHNTEALLHLQLQIDYG